ncbi:UDP-N-acetylmuramate dehydrogenase [Myceligenerans xiligouense]|uniref:UDP-N-acetylmuramate dehydrogenase n=1 Tax=Myceligenerans xiligouense TaxID=253184 RepID=UPI001FE769C6|nr:UDP-N-acetylmuramate dehydrogenase [Myceligenerans xiligouense]
MTADQDVLPHSAVVPSLADLTTLRVGGPVSSYVEAATEQEFLDAVRAADETGTPLLVVGGGSNLLVADEGFDGVVVRDARRGLEVASADACGGAVVSAPAGQNWDELVREAVDAGWCGVEALSGIPGTVGAAPVQNIGAYGQEVSSTLASIRVWDRAQGRVRTITNSELGFGYRTSVLKRSMHASGRQEGEGDPLAPWYPTPRYVVLDVTFQMRLGTLSAPIAYAQLAARLGAEQGDRVPSQDVREAVLELRSSKGMVLDRPDAPDHDRWSAGSFFTNPIVPVELAERLPAPAPRFPVRRVVEPGQEATVDPTCVKTSAAWLIQHAGFAPGFGLIGEHSPARLSTKHTLALTNRGSARSEDLIALARAVRDGVRERFGITLVPEPVLVGVAL